MDDKNQLISLLKNKRVLFVATKNADYIRIQQEIDLIKTYAYEYDIISSDKKSYFQRIIEVYKKLIFTSFKTYDVIFVGFMAQMIIPFFYWKWRKQTVITDFFISVFDTLVDDRKKLSACSLLGRFVKCIDEITIQKSDYIVADTKSHAEYFVKDLGAENEKCMVLYLKADTNIYYPKKLEKPDKYKDKYLVLYFGSILPLQGVEYVLEAIRLLQNEKGIHFIMIGPLGEKYQKVESDTVTYIDWLPQEKLAEYIAFSDLCLGGHFNPNIGKADRTIPGKVYIYAVMEKPIVLGDSRANRELYKETNQIHFVHRGSGIELSKKILDIYKEVGFER